MKKDTHIKVLEEELKKVEKRIRTGTYWNDPLKEALQYALNICKKWENLPSEEEIGKIIAEYWFESVHMGVKASAHSLHKRLRGEK